MIFRRQLNGLKLGIIRTNISHEKVVQTKLQHVLCAIVKAKLLNYQSSSDRIIRHH